MTEVVTLTSSSSAFSSERLIGNSVSNFPRNFLTLLRYKGFTFAYISFSRYSRYSQEILEHRHVFILAMIIIPAVAENSKGKLHREIYFSRVISKA